jgi:hypothetical protein
MVRRRRRLYQTRAGMPAIQDCMASDRWLAGAAQRRAGGSFSRGSNLARLTAK